MQRPRNSSSVERARWPNHRRRGQGQPRRRASHHREQDGGGDSGLDQAAPADVDGPVRRAARAPEPEVQGVLRAVLDAVHAQVALGDTQLPVWVAGTLAVAHALAAVGALVDVALDAQRCPPGEHAKQRTQRTQHPAPEARHEAVGDEDGGEQQRHQHAALKDRRLEMDGKADAVESGQHAHRERPVDERDRVEQPDLQRAERGQHQQGHEQVVLDAEHRPVGVQVLLVRGLAAVEQPAEDLARDSQRADPGAEEAPEEQGRHDDAQGERQALVQGAAGEEGGECGERVELQKQRDLPALHAPVVGNPQQEQEQGEEEQGPVTAVAAQTGRHQAHGLNPAATRPSSGTSSPRRRARGPRPWPGRAPGPASGRGTAGCRHRSRPRRGRR